MLLAIRSGVAHTVWLDDIAALRTAQALYDAMDKEADRLAKAARRK